MDNKIKIKPKKEKMRAFDVANVVIMLLFAAAVILPLLSVVSGSLVTSREMAQRRYIIFPHDIDFTVYLTLLKSGGTIVNGYLITIFRVVVGTAVNMLFTYFTGYAMAKKDLPGRTFITFFFFFTMLFSAPLIPYYITIKAVGLMTTCWFIYCPASSRYGIRC